MPAPTSVVALCTTMGSERTRQLLALCALILVGAACTGPAESADSVTTTTSELTAASGAVEAAIPTTTVDEGSRGSTSTLGPSEPTSPPGFYVSPTGDDGAVGTSPEEAEAIYKLTTLPTMEERFVLPPYHREMSIESLNDPLAHKGQIGVGYLTPPGRGA